MSSIREAVAEALWQGESLRAANRPRGISWNEESSGTQRHFRNRATTAITAFLETAAEQGWHMRPDEATEEMKAAGSEAWSEEKSPDYIRRVMNAAAPPFEWDK